ILNHHTLKLEQINKNFITKHEPISLYNYEEELYIITRTDTGQIFKCKLDLYIIYNNHLLQVKIIVIYIITPFPAEKWDIAELQQAPAGVDLK
ncbi:MAG: hypothetical protein QMC48_01415, partial [SAR324 cluster bacterium]